MITFADNMDLIREVVSTPYAFPAGIVVLVISCAILVFVFGFKSAEEPSFDQLSFSNEDRKPAGKKRKLKDKKSQSNGHVVTSVKDKSSKSSSEEGSKATKQSSKEAPKEASKKKDQHKEKRQDAKKASSPVQKQSKKAGKDAQEIVKNDDKQEKIDDDDGWEQVGKKNRKGSPQATEEKAPTSPSKDKKTKKTAAEKAPETVVAPLVLKEETQAEKPDTPTEDNSNIKPVPVKEIPKSPAKNKEEVKTTQQDVKPPEPRSEEKKEKKNKKAVVDTAIITSSKAPDDAETSSDKVEGAVFDELGDVWTEKVPKKSKKKVRKE